MADLNQTTAPPSPLAADFIVDQPAVVADSSNATVLLTPYVVTADNGGPPVDVWLGYVPTSGQLYPPALIYPV